MTDEFQLINRYFKPLAFSTPDLIQGIGDDGAVIQPPPNECLVISTDSLVENVHFFAGTAPEIVGYKSVAVNLSDMAAMGASPRWLTLALTLPSINETWIAGFCQGFQQLLQRFNVNLIGGNLSKGSLSVTVQVMGTTPQAQLLYRHGAQAGDKIYVTGALGDAAGALYLRKHNQPVPSLLQTALDRPEPQVTLGKQLGGRAHSAIDISDGLLADVTHLMEASGKQAHLNHHALPVSTVLKETVGKHRAYELALSGGDDYSLCFTLPSNQEQWLKEIAQQLCITCIGEVHPGSGVKVVDATGATLSLPNQSGYLHW